jgi:hypothetical protein
MNTSSECLLLMIGRIRSEIDCRIEHGADSKGHLEYIRDMIDKEVEKTMCSIRFSSSKDGI